MALTSRRPLRHRRNPDAVRFDSAAEAERAALAARPSVLANPNFQRWFRGSQVVDAEGQPLVVYHGTNSRDVFTEFSDEDAPYRGGLLAFFSTSPAFAQGYGKYVYPAYLSCGDLFDFRDAQDATRAVERFYGRGGVRDNEEARRILMSLSRTHPEIDVEDISDRRYSSDDLTDELFLEAVLEGAWPALECDEFVLFLRNRWNCDGIVLLEEDAINYGIFEPTQVKSATANNGDYDGDAPDIRHNPMRFVIAYEPEQAEELKWSRAARSIISPALQRKNVERMANSPHNFVVMLRGGYHPVHAGWLAKPPVFADAVTLVVSVSFAAEEDEESSGAGRANRESLYTAFTYLHKFGDAMVEAILGTGAISGEDNLLAPIKRFEDNDYPMFYEMFDEHMALLEKVYSNRRNAYNAYTAFLQHAVNSKMVREGYSVNWTQALADLFPLCELTPPSRPLLLPVEAESAGLLLRAATVFNESILPDFNVRFRAFYNDLVPRFYGEVVEV